MNKQYTTPSREHEGIGNGQHVILRLFIAGASLNSRRAVMNLKELCDVHIRDRYSLEIIDVHQEKTLTDQERIVALPLLVKCSPLPERRVIGDMSDTRKVLKGLGLFN